MRYISALFIDGPLHGQLRCLRELRAVEAAVMDDTPIARYGDSEPINMTFKKVRYRPTGQLGGLELMVLDDMEPHEAINRILKDFMEYGRVQKFVRQNPWAGNYLDEMRAS